VPAHASFASLEDIATESGFSGVQGILMDLGLSSLQLADRARGFSFQADGPLDMRFCRSCGVPASDLVNELPESDLADIIFRFGDERASRRIARAIVRARPIWRTGRLAELVAEVVRQQGRIHPATKTFQALRIAVNGELEALEKALPQAVGLLAPEGRLIVISFHSLEDRIVKQFLQRESRDCVCPPGIPQCACGHSATVKVITRRPLRPTSDEVGNNPRSRSARLRAAARLPSPRKSTEVH
jgi:16S rRNA (cytosine1402-N4)-methyltransferase